MIDEKDYDDLELYCDKGPGNSNANKHTNYDVTSYKMPAKVSAKAQKKKKKYSLMKKFAMTIGAEDNDNYNMFEEHQ